MWTSIIKSDITNPMHLQIWSRCGYLILGPYIYAYLASLF